MATLEQVMVAFYDRIELQIPSLPKIYQGSGGEPPDTGVWLELDVFPNNPLHPGLSLKDSRTDQGLLQAAVVTRASPNGYFTLAPYSRQVMEAFPIGYVLTGKVRITQEPSEMRVERQSPDRIMLVVTLRYRG